MSESDELKGTLIVGIDLGTTQSAVAVRDANGLRVLADVEGHELTPSVVGWDSSTGSYLVGRAAQSLGEHKPQAVAYSLKRFIGRWFTDKAVLYGREDLTYELVSGGRGDQLRDVLVDFGHDALGAPLRRAIPEVSAMVLDKLRRDAATSLGVPLESVTRGVITVPAYFNVLQRKATLLAGELAGLEKIDILNEPTAAALAYADEVLGLEERRILIYDLGGGTFDVSLLEASRDEVGYQFYTRVVDGDTRLGGDDIDTRVVHWLAEEIERRYGSSVRQDDQVTRARLRSAAERAKIALSTEEAYEINLPALELGSRPAFDATVQITRDQLEACAEETVRKARAIARRAVEEVAGLRWQQIDEVILVGGQTLMPAVQRDVADFTGHTPRVNDRPYLAVALGAAEYANILSQGRERFHENTLINVIALPVGIRLDDDKFQPIVHGNVTVPHISAPFPVTTTDDNQTHIKVEVLQGPNDATLGRECVLLGSIDMEVPPLPAKTPKFEVVFDVRSDGTLKVIVTDTHRKRNEELDIVENRALAWSDKHDD